MKNSSLSQGIEAAARGDLESAKNHFMAAVKAEPRNENAWLLLGHVLDNKEKQKTCYERVLHINPHNQNAKISLERPDNPPRMMVFHTLQSQTGYSPKKNKPKNKLRPLYITLIVVLSIVAIYACGVFLFQRWVESRFFTLDMLPFMPSQNIDTSDLPKSIELADGSIVYSDFGFIFQEDGLVVTAEPPAEYIKAVDKAEEYGNNKEYEKAIEEWNTAIEIAPHDDNAYYNRGKNYWNLTNGEHTQEIYTSNLFQAAKDVKQAIDLNSDELEYHQTYLGMLQDVAFLNEMRVDRELVFDIIIDEARNTLLLEMPYWDEMYITRLMADFSIEAGKCEEGLAILEEIEPEVSSDDLLYGGVLRIRAKGQACLGQVDDAIINMDKSMFNNDALDDKEYKKALYQYLAGYYEDSMQTINSTLDRKPSFKGYRYYVRSILNYENEDIDNAWEDLQTGEMYTWDRTGLYPYIYAKLIMEEDQETGIYFLQLAEATMFSDSFALREKILQELEEQNAEPLEVTPSTELQQLLSSLDESY